MTDILERKRLKAMLAYERQAKAQGFQKVCGVDEAGRGPLAGPVVAAACILPEHIFSDPILFRSLNDSKKMDASDREDLFHLLTGHPGVHYGIGLADHEEIDTVNILQATILAMKIAINELLHAPDLVLLDGRKQALGGLTIWAIIKGDELSLSIAAASVIAKVTRDRMMVAYHEDWPEYGFKQHKGYGTKAHLEAIAKHGPCPIHRRSFAPITASFE
jgi:ribonuclease HII